MDLEQQYHCMNAPTNTILTPSIMPSLDLTRRLEVKLIQVYDFKGA